jgi:hypothetical protein
MLPQNHPKRAKEEGGKTSTAGRFRTIDTIPHGSFYFMCPAADCKKVSLWGHAESLKRIAIEQGMKLHPIETPHLCRQIDNSVQQKIKCLNRPGYAGMKEHLKVCPHWRAEVKTRLELIGASLNDDEPVPIDQTAPLYQDRRVKIKPEGTHNLTREEKRALQNERQRKQRAAWIRVSEGVAANWEAIAPVMNAAGFKKIDIPVQGEGFMFEDS